MIHDVHIYVEYFYLFLYLFFRFFFHFELAGEFTAGDSVTMRDSEGNQLKI